MRDKDTQIESLQLEIKKLNSEKSDYLSILQQFQTSPFLLNEEIKSLKNQLASANTTLGNLQKMNSKLELEITKLKK